MDKSKFLTLEQNYEALVSSMKLNDKQKSNPITYKQMVSIIEECNSVIAKTEELSIAEMLSKKGAYSKYASAIICKLVALIGTKNAAVLSIKLGDFEEATRALKIGGCKIILPHSFVLEIAKYRSKRIEMIGETNEKSLLFAKRNEKKLDNATAFKIVQSFTDKTSAIAVSKYVIIQHIKNGMPSYMIEDITGCKSDILRHCQELLREEYSDSELVSVSEQVNNYLQHNEIYHYL